MIRRALFFVAPGQVEVREEEVSEPGAGEVMVETLVSGISAGSELLVFRGQAPEKMAVDMNISVLSGNCLAFPLKYGYSVVGRVNRLGPKVGESWLDRTVFSFQPHQSHFVAQTSDLFPLREGITAEEAVLLPNLETAVSLVMDGRPLIGEAVVVFGQGIVGLLTTALLSPFSLGRLLTLDRYSRRRELSRKLGAQESLDPADPLTPSRLAEALAATDGADLVYELSGNPDALNMAVEACGFAGRIVVGSWYGQKQTVMDLGSKFHRGRMKLVSSQVSTLAPELTGRWSKTRRLDLAWQRMEAIGPARFVTRRFPLEQAREAYQLLHKDPAQDLQIVLTYGIQY